MVYFGMSNDQITLYYYEKVNWLSVHSVNNNGDYRIIYLLP